ncbi:hypothetical protein BLNAU_13832 [Blattamonas nauphoetae]|uniref:Uncharacterized protein n=1 Tax=Blattamonas nauphoetae TaxID=2049346 RepID=A0ABQ9XFG9_9EUKA|nr:hypothetical protein BLNAU_13832 [Blattamonas nauphoetae]
MGHIGDTTISDLSITDTVDAFDHCELIFRKVVLPSSLFVMAFSCCVSIVERDYDLWVFFGDLDYSLQEWKVEGPEVTQSGKRMMQALFSEGFEDILEQTLMHNEGGHGFKIVEDCYYISQLLGLNVEFTERLRHR